MLLSVCWRSSRPYRLSAVIGVAAEVSGEDLSADPGFVALFPRTMDIDDLSGRTIDEGDGFDSLEEVTPRGCRGGGSRLAVRTRSPDDLHRPLVIDGK